MKLKKCDRLKWRRSEEDNEKTEVGRIEMEKFWRRDWKYGGWMDWKGEAPKKKMKRWRLDKFLLRSSEVEIEMKEMRPIEMEEFLRREWKVEDGTNWNKWVLKEDNERMEVGRIKMEEFSEENERLKMGPREWKNGGWTTTNYIREVRSWEWKMEMGRIKLEN